MSGTAADELTLRTRRQVASQSGGTDFRVREEVVRWSPGETALVICDMWDRHWCRGATERVAAMAPRMNEFVKVARDRGVLIIHCPSATMKFYEGTPQRRLAQSAPVSELKVPVQGWCGHDPAREGPLPIDDSDGGCDDEPRCSQGSPWTRQIATLEIREGDAITDSAEALHLMAQRGIRHVLVMGVHLNMCVLGRPFAIRQLVQQGKDVVLVRDLTDTMYNSRSRPQVNHFTGTDLMIEHVERYWCASTTSSELLGGKPFRFPADQRPRVVTMIGEDEYRTWETLPGFATSELLPAGYSATMIHERADDPGNFPTLEQALADADLLVLSARRRALPPAQMAAVRRHLDSGRPLIAIRTSSHGFAPRGAAGEAVKAGLRSAWVEFDPSVLGGNYQGHHGKGPKTALSVSPQGTGHAILEGVEPGSWSGHGSLYRLSPLAASARPLLIGTVEGEKPEPVAWTHVYGKQGAKIFYTSLGDPEDFGEAGFRRMLVNAARWCLETDPGPAARR